MERKSARLYFIDAMRAWAILMMLQGHFVDGLLDMGFRDNSAGGYTIWKYFRGITAPVFFTVSGFIFTYLLVRVPQTGFDNPRIKKGLKRGLQLLLIGYLLRLNLFGLLQGQIYDAFYLVDVLHCIGLSILGIIGLYLITYKQKRWLFPAALATITVLLFLLEPWYKQFSYSFLPDALANYFTKANGSVFTIFPWFGYTAFGGFLSLLFTRFRDFKYLYPIAIGSATVIGLTLIFYSSHFFLLLSKYTDIQLFERIYFNNYLFIRLGDVFLVLAVFMLFRGFLTHKTLIKIGQSTLSIYVVHFIILYGSFTGLGLYRFFHHSLTPQIVIPSALVFMFLCTYTALLYERHKVTLKSSLISFFGYMWAKMEPLYLNVHKTMRASLVRILRLFGLVKN
ncbi:heparan-alpha-glucosaminide N-acetyltransferase domain-containing protein [Ulvibacterium sp.]|uniref:heparan-alpha-glucosaminide N-acetyltransferase domain-containing protein n=1 Tax=Ulvibacterium sp. TaxID=2665914 RepID=UPI00260FF652|nr:heparan-alpha-glucosaminide N-acetyltransferase domain-containing protein [Ulvibacterium sp.]